MTIEALEMASTDAAAAIRDGRLHVAVCFEDAAAPPREHPDALRHEIAREPMDAAVGPDHPLAGRRRIALAALADDTWTAPSREHLVRRACVAAGFEPRIDYVTRDPLAIAGIIRAGLARVADAPPARGPPRGRPHDRAHGRARRPAASTRSRPRSAGGSGRCGSSRRCGPPPGSGCRATPRPARVARKREDGRFRPRRDEFRPAARSQRVTPNLRSPVSTTTSTINKVGVVCIPVSDQDRALAFYVDVLGLEKRADVPFGNGYRWVEVAPPGGDARIAIVPPPEGKPTGNMETGIGLETQDIDAVHAALKERGADVDDEISRMGDPVPPLFWFRDPDGNTLMVVEAP